MKLCHKCGESKPTTEFYKCASKSDGLQSRCKSCDGVISAKWRAANPEKDKARTDKWQAANREKRNASAAKYRAANPEKVKAAAKRAANSDKVKATWAAWRAANHEKRKAKDAKWRAANPEAMRIHSQNRRARERDAGGKLSIGLSDRLFKLQRGKCACGCKQPLGDKFHLDHRMPLALGGTNTDDNIQLLRDICNLHKSAKHPVDFMQQRGFLI